MGWLPLFVSIDRRKTVPHPSPRVRTCTNLPSLAAVLHTHTALIIATRSIMTLLQNQSFNVEVYTIQQSIQYNVPFVRRCELAGLSSPCYSPSKSWPRSLSGGFGEARAHRTQRHMHDIELIQEVHTYTYNKKYAYSTTNVEYSSGTISRPL